MNLQEQIKRLMLDDNLRCQCDLCQRTKKFFAIIDQLPDEDKEWMAGFYDYVIEHEEHYDLEVDYWKWKYNNLINGVDDGAQMER